MQSIFEYLLFLASYLITLTLGTWLPLMTTLLVLNGADILAGLVKGGKDPYGIDSKKLYDGIRKKVGQWILIIVANSIDVLAFDNVPVAKSGVLSYLIGYEGLSITENLALMGVPISGAVTKYLHQLRDSNEDSFTSNKEDKNN